MIPVTIYYKKSQHPTHYPKWGKIYMALHDEESEVVYIPHGFFRYWWRKLPKVEIIDDNLPIEPQLEEIYKKYNFYETNPYSSEQGQREIRNRGVKHTSMSMGDVIKVDNDYYIVAGIGFKKIKFI